MIHIKLDLSQEKLKILMQANFFSEIHCIYKYLKVFAYLFCDLDQKNINMGIWRIGKPSASVISQRVREIEEVKRQKS